MKDNLISEKLAYGFLHDGILDYSDELVKEILYQGWAIHERYLQNLENRIAQLELKVK